MECLGGMLRWVVLENSGNSTESKERLGLCLEAR